MFFLQPNVTPKKTIRFWPAWVPLAVILLSGTLTQAQAAGSQQLHGHLRSEWAAAPLGGNVSDSQQMTLSITLPVRNPDALQDLLKEIYDPKSPHFRHFLSSEDFTRMFGPTEADYQAVIEFVKQNHLTVVSTQSNRQMLTVRGFVGDIRRTFHVNLFYHHRAEGPDFYAPDVEPSIDLDVPVLHIGGLDSFGEMHHGPVIKTGGTLPAPGSPKGHTSSGTGPDCGGGNSYISNDLRAIFVPCTSLEGAGQTVALFEEDNYFDADVASYANLAGFSTPPVSRVLVDETSAQTPSCGNGEVSLDIDMVMAIAPKANILVYEGPSTSNPPTCSSFGFNEPNDILSKMASDNLAKQISSSWFWGGFNDSSAVSQTFATFAAQGQTFFEASEDKGAYVAGDPLATPPQPMWQSPFMTIVGGTVLTTTGTGTGGQPTPVGSYVSETTWNFSPGPAATQTPPPNAVSGGGFCSGSNSLAIPTYQVPFVNAQNGASSVDRNLPDVAWVASNLSIVSGNGSIGCGGGTSAAAPMWAGLMALVNEEGVSLGLLPKGGVGDINPTLYNLGSNPVSYANDFHDIQDGSNNNYWGTNPNLYKSVNGFDLTTGLGSPKCNLIDDILGISPTPTFTSTNTFTPTPTPCLASFASPNLDLKIKRIQCSPNQVVYRVAV
ncbi:MAG TPA: S53 family peptidase [bacterium]|jgi:subtilase family serine protease|nr:S53 family peptidase [bacterium]